MKDNLKPDYKRAQDPITKKWRTTKEVREWTGSWSDLPASLQKFILESESWKKDAKKNRKWYVSPDKSRITGMSNPETDALFSKMMGF